MRENKKSVQTPFHLLNDRQSNEKAKVISSFAMFYDLEDPVSFATQIRNLLLDDGIWVFEQSFLPTMLEANAYDTVCHEHIEYYMSSTQSSWWRTCTRWVVNGKTYTQILNSFDI